MTREPGSSVGDYRILASLGAGASGEVYKAEHVITRRVDALKLLAHDARTSDEERQRFLREIQLQASLRHRNIAAVHSAFRTPEGLALAMELVEGEPLAAILARGRVPLSEGAGYLLETLDALQYAHDRGVVHRDVKPANIMVAPDGGVKLTDFGLARRAEGPQLTHSGAFAGSPYYMSPEQVVGLSAPDRRCDIYAAGVVLYEIAVGKRPFEDASAFEVMLQHRDAEPEPPPELDPALAAVIRKAMAKDPARRYQSAAEFREALAAVLDGAAPPRMPPRFRLPAMAAAAVVLAACVAAGMTWRAGREPVPPPPLPRAPRAPEALWTAAPAAPRVSPPRRAEEEPDLPVIVRQYAPRPAARPAPAVVEAAPPVLPPAPSGAGVPGPAPEVPPTPSAAAAQSPVAAPLVVPPPPRRRHVVWRTLGKAVRPLARRKPEAAAARE